MLFSAAFYSLLLASVARAVVLGEASPPLAFGAAPDSAAPERQRLRVVSNGTTIASSSLATVTVTVTPSECVLTNATSITLNQCNGKLATGALTSTVDSSNATVITIGGTTSTVTVAPTRTVVTLTAATSVATGVNGTTSSTVSTRARTTTEMATQVSSSSAEIVTQSAS
ncbi:hypothetical protein CPB85DRAFT_1566105 [Mucidula mucida]|nr:hypothetical protein CPB85DRAFT_1566105 [Mucidula mucida]